MPTEPAPTFSDLPQIAHQGAPVLTTEQLARAYGVEPKVIHDGFARNEAQFQEGLHYHKLAGSDLRAFKNRPALNGLVGAQARSLLLWTERGAARHAKMISSPEAWSVFDRLEAAYFNVQAGPAYQPAAIASESEVVFRSFFNIATLIGYEKPIAALSANRATHDLTGLDILAKMGATALVSERQERVLTASDVGVEIGGLSAIAVNKLLIRHGFQTETRDAKERPVKEPTGKGDPFKVWVDTGKRHGDGSPVHQLKWTVGIVAALRAEMGDTAVEIAA